MPTVHVKISTDISPDDLAVLRQFHERVLVLANTKLVKGKDSRINASLSLNAGDGLRVEVKLPPEEQLAQFLMAFRFFYQKKEPTHFPRIVNLVAKYADDAYKDVARFMKSQWKNSLFNDAAKVALNGQAISASQLIDLWFNAHYFHSDVVKRAELDKLNSVLQVDLCKFMLVDSTYNASDVVRRFHAGIGELFMPVGTLV